MPPTRAKHNTGNRVDFARTSSKPLLMFVRQRRSNGFGASTTLPIISPESVLPPEGQTRHRRILASSVLLIDRSYFIGWVVIVALSIFCVSLVWRPILAFFALKAQSVRHYNHQGEQDASAGKSSLPLSKFSELSYALKNSDLVALYFAASWCPMSTPISLALDSAFGKTDMLLSNEGGRKILAVVYVSSDETLDEFNGYIRNRQWLAVPYESKQRNDLKRHFSTCAKRELEDLNIDRKHEIPTIIVIDSETHGIITTNGADDVDQMGEDSLQHWKDIQDWIRNIRTNRT